MRRALAFLTFAGGPAAPTPGAVRWFPVVGALVGGAVGCVWWGADHLWAPALAAALTVVADLVLTGGLHADGVADSADGLLAPMERQRRLEVMADPRTGAFGALALAATLLVRWAAFASIEPSVWLVAGLWCLSRTVMAVALRALPYARAGGLAEPFRAQGRGPVVVGATGAVLTAVLLAAAGPALGATALAAALVALAAGTAVLWLAHRRLGGYTGDVLGAAGVMAETAGLVAAAARW